MLQVGILGFGKLGQALSVGIKKSKLRRGLKVSASVRRPNRARELTQKFGIPVLTSNAEVVKKSDVLILAVKPSQAEKVLRELSRSFKSHQILVSVCASIQHQQLRRWAGAKPKIIRAMPNLPSLIGEGITVLSPDKKVSLDEVSRVEGLFATLGDVLSLDESHFDAVTALSACGPAFIFMIIESFIEAGVKVGLPREVARRLSLQTMIGSGRMVQKLGVHPATLRDQVTTPAGCTIDGLVALEDGKLRATLIRAIQVSTNKASKLRQKN